MDQAYVESILVDNNDIDNVAKKSTFVWFRG